MRLATVFLLFVVACSHYETDAERWAREKREEWEGPCADTATLLATTAGSPDTRTCPNKRHRMEVQVATHPSNEEAAALVFCRCVRDGEERDR